MCRRVECSKCGRPTYAGCGQHIEQVLGNVPKAERCRCREKDSTRSPASPQQKEQRSWLSALFGGKGS
jgi:hypothetical protein